MAEGDSLVESAQLPSWKRQAQRLSQEARVFYFAFKHPRVPWYARLIAVCTAAYLFSPVQLIPSYIPLIGFLDDVLVLFVGVKILRKIIPPDVLMECRALADAAEMRRKERIQSVGAAVGFAMIVSLWLLGTVFATVLIVKYFRH
jgi:uncharacterized membrane protein YkvA (DUF1232 family)